MKEVTFLGQNVNSYHDVSMGKVDDGEGKGGHRNSEGFVEMFKLRDNPGVRFA